MLYLMNGRFARLDRLLYAYDIGVWQTAETAQKKDLEFYKGAGLDPSVNKLHWFLCGFEGAALIPQLKPFSFRSGSATSEHGRSVVLNDVSPVQGAAEIHVRFSFCR
jgi:hypothetical protein